MKEDNDKKVRQLIILHFLYIIKGVLISEGILALVPLPRKGAKSLPGAENLSFTPISVNNLLAYQCYRQWLFKAPLCITLKIKIWVVAYFFNIFKLFKKNYKSHFM